MDLPWDERPYVPPVIPGFKTPKLDMSKPLPPREPMSPAAIEYERRKNLPEPWNAQTIRKVIAEGPDGPDLHRYKGKEGEGDHFAIKHQHTAMWYAAKLGLWDEVLQLLDMGADPQAMDEYEYTALMWAARADRMDVIKKLLDKGADIDQMTQYGWTSVMWAKKYQPDAGVARLGIPPYSWGIEILHGAGINCVGKHCPTILPVLACAASSLAISSLSH